MYVLMKIRISQHHHHMTLDDRTHHAFQHLMMITSHSCEHAAVVERGWFCINSTTPFPKSEEQGKLRPTVGLQGGSPHQPCPPGRSQVVQATWFSIFSDSFPGEGHRDTMPKVDASNLFWATQVSIYEIPGYPRRTNSRRLHHAASVCSSKPPRERARKLDPYVSSFDFGNVVAFHYARLLWVKTRHFW